MKLSEEMLLSSGNIDAVAEEIGRTLKSKGVSKSETIKIRLKAEETMCFYQNKFGENSKFRIKYTSGFDKRISLMFEGEKVKPFKDERDEFTDGIMKMLGEVDGWQYKHNTNIVDFKIPKRIMSQIVQIGIALICVVLFTLVSYFLVPKNVTDAIQSTVLSPLADLFIGVLRSASCLLIFTSIVLSIVNIGDIRSLKKIGKSLFSDLFLFMLLSVAATFVFLIPWMRFSAGNGGETSNLVSELVDTVLKMVPMNPISPFMDGNAVQVIMLALFCGVIFAVLGEKVSSVKRGLQDVDTFISCAIEKINLLLPLLVFVVVENTVLSNKISTVISQKAIVLMWAIAIALQLIINSVCVSVFGKMSIFTYFKKAKAPLTVSLLTSSSVAALPSNMDVCKKEFKIDKKLANLGIPIGQVMFMPCSAAVMIATCVGAAYISGTAVTPSWILTVVIVSIVLAVATPPTPGAALMVYSLLFTQMGLSREFFGVTVALGAITDSVVTTSNVFSLHYLLLKVNNKNKIKS